MPKCISDSSSNEESGSVLDIMLMLHLVHVESAVTFLHGVLKTASYMFVLFFQGVVQLRTKDEDRVSSIDRGSQHEVANPFLQCQSRT